MQKVSFHLPPLLDLLAVPSHLPRHWRFSLFLLADVPGQTRRRAGGCWNTGGLESTCVAFEVIKKPSPSPEMSPYGCSLQP